MIGLGNNINKLVKCGFARFSADLIIFDSTHLYITKILHLYLRTIHNMHISDRTNNSFQTYGTWKHE